MALDVWQYQTGINLANIWNSSEYISERVRLYKKIPIIDEINPDDFEFSIISGKLPTGLRLEGAYITGVPAEVSVITKTKVVFRSKYKISKANVIVNSVPIGHYLYINDIKYTANTENPNDLLAQLNTSTTFTTSIVNNKWILTATDDNSIKFSIDYQFPTQSLIDIFEFGDYKHLSDRTYEIKIEGPDEPIWTTKPGRLDIGPNRLTFILDSSYVYYKLGAVDTDLATIQNKIEKDFTVVGTKTNTDIETYIQQTGNELINNTIVINGVTVLITGNTLTDIARDINFANIPNVFSAVIDGKLEIYTTDLSITISKGTGNLIGDTVDFSVLGIKQGLYQFDTVNTYIKFYIDNGDGELPPGLKLKEDGTIYGIVSPVLALLDDTATGFYDTTVFDGVPFDIGVNSDTGFDSFFYDDSKFDFSMPTKPTKKLNRNYSFTVTVTDGEFVTKRDFIIYVVGDEFLTADNSIIHLGNNTFTADSTNLRTPIWISPKNLGVRRANNYITILLDIYDPNPKQPPILVELVSGELPPGLKLDRFNYEIFGYIPYQPAVTKEYRFTLKAWRYNPLNPEIAFAEKEFIMSVIGEIDSVIVWNNSYDLGSIAAGYESTKFVSASTTVPDAVLTYKLVGGQLPPGLKLTSSGEIINKIRQFGKKTLTGYTTIDGGYLKLDTNLTTLDLQFPIAKTESERFPYTGLTHIDYDKHTTFDGGTTYFDRSFYFGIKAYDQFEYSAILGIFKLTIEEEDTRNYTNIYMHVFPPNNIRKEFTDFITDFSVFEPKKMYRLSDPNFGIQAKLKMLVYAGIEEKDLEYYVSAMMKNHGRKRLLPGNIKSARALTPGTNTIEYEIVYLEMLDPIDSSPLEIKYKKQFTVDQTVDETRWSNLQDNSPYKIYLNMEGLRVDSDVFLTDNVDMMIKYPNSIKNMRRRIKQIGYSKLQHLPLWMRSPQPNTYRNIGYVKAIPLCYCLPGWGDYIKHNVIHSGFDFRIIDFDFDRYIINVQEQDRYFVFPVTQFN